MKLFLTCLIAGLGAGIGTGFVGLSAATIISPMLIAFLGYPWYESIGIGLASDVLASAFSAAVYAKNKNIDMKNGLLMMISVFFMTIIGSYFSQYMPDTQMGWFSILMSVLMGLRFIRGSHKEQHAPALLNKLQDKRKLLSIACGMVIGFDCGFIGAGGGLMMLLILTFVLGYELKMAVGTSVLVMTFTALTGSVSHFYFGDITEYVPALILCAIFTLAAALASSWLANRLDTRKTNLTAGSILIVLGICMIVQELI